MYVPNYEEEMRLIKEAMHRARSEALEKAAYLIVCSLVLGFVLGFVLGNNIN